MPQTISKTKASQMPQMPQMPLSFKTLIRILYDSYKNLIRVLVVVGTALYCRPIISAADR